MEKTESLKKNFFYNFSLNIINILFPLITAPYVSRVLGANNLGKYNFSLSFSSWFLIFATFGTTTYGIREISKVRDNRKKLDKTFSEIFLINFITTLITLIVYITVIFIIPKTNKEILLFLIFSISIFMNLFCIDWFYMGIEEYGLITLRSLVIKIICLVCIFVFIKQKNDYSIYALISVLAFGFANIFNFMYSRKFVRLIFKGVRLKRHLSKLIIFFTSSLIISIYTTFDQVFLGFNSSTQSVAFFSRTRQIYSMANSITLSISTVLLPKLTYLCENNFKEYKVLLKKSINYIYIFSIPFVFGLALLSKDIMWFFGGKEYEGAYLSLMIISSLVFTVSLGTWQYDQLFLPLGREKVGLKGQILMAVVSLTSNIILTPKYGYVGASISILLAESSGTIYGVYYAKKKIKEVKINYITNSFRRYIFASFFMSIVIILFKQFKFSYIINLLFSVIVAPFVYFLILYMVNDTITKEIINYFHHKFKKTIKKVL